MATFKSDGMAIIAVFIGAIIAATFIASIATDVVPLSTTSAKTNTTAVVAAAGSATNLVGRELITGRDINNGTLAGVGGQIFASGNLTLRTGWTTGGLKTVQLFTNTNGSTWTGSTVNVSYDYQPDGYLPIGGARSIANLIVIMSALAIAVFVIVVFWKTGSLGKLVGRG